jgi:AcrR family transcriptional regulator
MNRIEDVAKRALKSGPRGLNPDVIVAAALAVYDAGGPADFSMRKVAARVGCDPMAVLYHFGSKDGLERAMADAINAALTPVDHRKPWKQRLRDLTQQYRRLAQRFPHSFQLLMRFWATGRGDYRHLEMLYQTFRDAGLKDQHVVDVCCGWYAAVLGLVLAETGGLLVPADAIVIAEVEALPPQEFPHTTSLLPLLRNEKEYRACDLTLETLLNGIEKLANDTPALARPRATPRSKKKSK